MKRHYYGQTVDLRDGAVYVDGSLWTSPTLKASQLFSADRTGAVIRTIRILFLQVIFSLWGTTEQTQRSGILGSCGFYRDL